MAKIHVGVAALHNSSNYGPCLQTYTTQKVLEGMGD